jgi:MYXO-CTERM domain-containing protein
LTAAAQNFTINPNLPPHPGGGLFFGLAVAAAFEGVRRSWPMELVW